MDSIFSHFGQFGQGFLLTLGMSAAALFGASVLGLLLAACRISPIPPLRALAGLYVVIFRNVPLLVLLVLFVFGLPSIGLLYPLFVTATAAVALYWAAFVCEVVRAGIRTVPSGQAEAARALGLGPAQLLWHVVFPQSLRAMVQPLGNVAIGLILSTSLAAAVGVSELTGEADYLTIQTASPIQVFLVAAAIYVALALCGSAVLTRIERKLAITR